MWILSLIRGKCPHCREGDIFYSLWGMHDHCAVCGIEYERESGFFSMSIFVGYVLAAVLALPPLGVVYALGGTLWWYVGAASTAVVVCIPLIFRYGRIIWLYIDEWLDPRRPDEIDYSRGDG